MREKLLKLSGSIFLLSFFVPTIVHARSRSGGVSDLVITAIVIFVVLFILFLLLREVNCWYWKINERLAVQKEIRDLLKISKSSETPKKLGPQEPLVDEKETFEEELKLFKSGICPNPGCGMKIVKDDTTKCRECGQDFSEYLS